MCGIVVALAFGKKTKKEEKVRQEVMRILTTELLLETESRGKDATGAAILFSDGNYYGIKRGDRSSKFLHMFSSKKKKDTYEGFLEVWKEHTSPVKVFLGHCRAGTTGENTDNNNNHPIKIGNIVGIHNGVIRNHNEIFEHLKCKRDGEVDSEAIFRLFDHFTNKGKELFTMEMLQNIVNRLEGSFAVTLFNADNLNQVPVFRDGRPVEFVLIKNLGILLMISEKKFWQAVYPTYERLAHYYAKLPTLLIEDNVQIETMPDDHAFIFDLTKNVDESTEINDLAEISKMDRTHKIWKSKTTTTGFVTTSNYGYMHRSAGYNVSQTRSKRDNKAENGNTSTKSKTDKSQKRRVFDTITKKYVIKVGDKVVDEDTEVIINSENDEATFTKDSKLELSSNQATINDITVYNESNKPDNDNVIDAEEVKDDKDIKSEDKITVNMRTVPVELIELAEEHYKSLDLTDKGFTDESDLMLTLELTKEQLEMLSALIVANRTYKYAWKKGYIEAALNDIPSKIIDKSIRRSKYIEKLKSIIVYLINFIKYKPPVVDTEIKKTIDDIRAVFDKDSIKAIDNFIEEVNKQ